MSILGSIGSAVTGGKGATKAAKIQNQAVDKQIGYLNQNRDFLYGLAQPSIDRGNQAGSLYADFLYGDPTKAAAALQQYRGSTGYQDLLNTGLGAVKSGAYASGMRDSGATLKALQQRGMSIADQSAQGWLNNLNQLIQAGQQSFGGVAGVGMNTVNGINNAVQNGADANSNAALIKARNWGNVFGDIDRFGSSFMGAGGFGG